MQIQKHQGIPYQIENKNSSKGSTASGQKKSFGSTLNNVINEVNKLQSEADQSVNSLVSGKNSDIHKTMIAMEKADISFRLMMQIRNKAIEAYQEVMRMQV